MKGHELDEKFDKGEEDVLDYFDLTTVRRPNQELKPIDLDLPVWAIRDLDAEAKRQGLTRQALIQSWIAERLEATRQNR